MGKEKPIVKKIDGMEFGIWFMITLIYVFFVMILNGILKSQFPEDVVYLFGVIPLDLNLGIWVFGVSMWIPVSVILKHWFMKRKVRLFKK